MKKEIVIISNYYPPEMGAAANRIKNLANGLYGKGYNVTIICPLPNYPQGKIFKEYKNKLYKKEIIDNIIVKRFWIFPSKSKSGIIRFLSMISFAFSMWFSVLSLLKKKPDTFIIQSPPLLVAFSGLLLSKFVSSKNILNVSDIWPLSALELGVIKKGKLYTLLEKIEKYNYMIADKIIGQSNEIIEHVTTIVKKETLVYRNVPSYKKYSPKQKTNNVTKIVYAGLLGYAQGILKVCEEINFKELQAEFHIYGAGMDEVDIKKIAATNKKNIFFHGVKTATEIKKEIQKYDIGFVPLKNRIYGAVPSKIFEIIQLGMPILFFGEGEGKTIIEENNLGITCNSNDFDSLRNKIIELNKSNGNLYIQMSKNCLDAHQNKYKLESQLEKIFKNNFLS